MKRRMTLVGLAALCAVAFSAIAASGASAGVTAYTCVKEPPTDVGHTWSDPHCTEEGSPKIYGHVEIPENTPTQITFDNIGTQKLSANVFGAEVELTSTNVECIECMAENKKNGGVMEVAGEGGHLKYTEVKVAKLEASCRVTSDGPVTSGVEGVVETEPLKFTTNTTGSVKLEPVAGTVLAHFNIVTAPGEHAKKCNLVGTHTVTGDASGTVSGSTLKVNVEKGSETLKLDGEPAALQGEVTLTAGTTKSEVDPNPVHNPVSLTEA